MGFQEIHFVASSMMCVPSEYFALAPLSILIYLEKDWICMLMIPWVYMIIFICVAILFLQYDPSM